MERSGVEGEWKGLDDGCLVSHGEGFETPNLICLTPSVTFSVPISKIPKMVQETSADALNRGLTACHFGHVVGSRSTPSDRGRL